jgi:hypothetical protein
MVTRMYNRVTLYAPRVLQGCACTGTGSTTAQVPLAQGGMPQPPCCVPCDQAWRGAAAASLPGAVTRWWEAAGWVLQAGMLLGLTVCDCTSRHVRSMGITGLVCCSTACVLWQSHAALWRLLQNDGCGLRVKPNAWNPRAGDGAPPAVCAAGNGVLRWQDALATSQKGGCRDLGHGLVR